MTTTAMTLIANRIDNDVLLQGIVTSVALDAAVDEFFTIPVGFGDLNVRLCEVTIGALNGAYLAPTPAYDGPKIAIIDNLATAQVDVIGSTRWVHSFTSSAQASLSASIELQYSTICRQGEKFEITIPISGAAGRTATIVFRVRGARLRNP